MDPDRLLDALPDLVFVIDGAGALSYINHACEVLLGWHRVDWIGRSVFEVVHPDDLGSSLSSLDVLQTHERGTPVELRVADVDGAWHWMEVIGANRTHDDGIDGLVCVSRDITQRRMWEVAGGDVARFQHMVQHAAAITLLVDEAGVVSGVSAAFARLLGHDPSLVVGRPLAEFVDPDARPRWDDAVRRVVSSRRGIAVELPMTRAAGGDPRPIRFELVDLLDDPVVTGIVVSGHDVTDLQQARDELEHQARHDALTGLANRTLLLDGMERSLGADETIAVVFIDLDRFKPVNDLYGHETGDTVLLHVAERLQRIVRPGDTVARVGGDEFVVLAPMITTWTAARNFAERIEAELTEPYVLDVGPVKIGASVGVAVSDAASTVVSLLADADVQMYDAKSHRRGLATRPAVERRRGVIERRRLADELAAGLGRDEVVAHLQPIVDLTTGALVGMEALARWNHPSLGVLSPVSFMDLVEDAALDIPFGAAVLQSAAASMRALARPDTDLTLAINLSIGQLSHVGLTEQIASVMEHNGLSMSDLVIEITERSTLSRHAGAGSSSPDATLRALHDAGAALSLDDFGTGYSSLTHVRRFPLRSIKVDQTFVAGMCKHAEDLAVVNVVIGLANALGLGVVAEGIETAEQYELLATLGCGFGQGYVISPPIAPDAVSDWVTARAQPPAR